VARKQLEDRLARFPEQFREEVIAKLRQFEWVIIDEVQKCPKLLNSTAAFVSMPFLLFSFCASDLILPFRQNSCLWGLGISGGFLTVSVSPFNWWFFLISA
jgi:hypothetical protein